MKLFPLVFGDPEDAVDGALAVKDSGGRLKPAAAERVVFREQ